MRIKTKRSMDYSIMIADFLVKDWTRYKEPLSKEDQQYLIKLSERFDALSDISRQLALK